MNTLKHPTHADQRMQQRGIRKQDIGIVRTYGTPDYRINYAELQRLAGDDDWANRALKHGHVKLQDIPEIMLGDDARDKRIEWLGHRVPRLKRQVGKGLGLMRH